MKCLSKYPYFKKPPQHLNISGCACVELYIDYQKGLTKWTASPFNRTGFLNLAVSSNIIYFKHDITDLTKVLEQQLNIILPSQYHLQCSKWLNDTEAIMNILTSVEYSHFPQSCLNLCLTIFTWLFDETSVLKVFPACATTSWFDNL